MTLFQWQHCIQLGRGTVASAVLHMERDIKCTYSSGRSTLNMTVSQLAGLDFSLTTEVFKEYCKSTNIAEGISVMTSCS